MKKKVLLILLVVFNISVIGFFLIWYLNRAYPMIGMDNRLFMPYMIDSHLHQKINGLTIQWYTPSFAGGRPVYTNPEDLQYSLPQFLMWLFNPWTALLASMIVFVTIGFIATYYFLKRLVGLGSFASILGAVFFIANGFYFQHMVIGHITFQLFPVFAVIMIIITHPRLPVWQGGLILSLVLSILFYCGIHNISFFILTSIITLPILYLIKPSLLNWRRIVLIGLWGGVLTTFICGSRIYAVYSFMRFFPRYAQDNYQTSFLTGIIGMVHQLVGTMTLAPIYRVLQGKYTVDWLIDLSKTTGTLYGYWELDASLSPALLLLLAGGAITYLFHKPKRNAIINKKRLLAVICLILAIWLVIEFTLAKGIIYPALRDLPILKSLRVNVRYISSFIFPLAVVGALIFNNWTKDWKSKAWYQVAFLLLDGIALSSIWIYHWVPTQYEVGARFYQYYMCEFQPILDTYDKIHYEGETFPIENIIPNDDPWAVFQDNATNLKDPYNMFFKNSAGYRKVLHAGSVYEVNNGYFNMINPTGYLFPEVNHSTMYERISVADKDKLDAFVNRHQPDWKLPVIQQVLDWIALISFIGTLVLIAFYIFRGRFRKRNQNKVELV